MSHSKKRKSLRRKVNTGLNFTRLEPRKMLAGDVPAGANLIVNGDFETFTNQETSNVINSFATARFYGSDLVPGWTVADGDGDNEQRINLLTFDNERGTVLDVDSTLGQDDRVFQDVNVSVGQQYLFSFDFFGPEQLDGATDPPSNEFEVYYNGELLGALDGTIRFQQASFVITGAANDSDGSSESGDLVSARFEFRHGTSGDRGGDGRGSLIDAVSLVAVTDVSVVNGDFESNDSADGPNFAPDDVDGFSLFTFADDTEDRVIQILSDDDSDGSFLNLNSSSGLTDQVFQDLSTEAGETYFVTFDLRVDPTSTSSPDELRVRFDNQYAATFIGTDQWQSHSVLVEATSDTSRLTFRESGEDSGDGASPQIDNVQFFQVNGIVVPPVNDLVVDANGADDGLNTAVVFEENGGPQTIASEVVISHDSGETLNLASIALIGDPILPTESLAVDIGSTGIVADYDSQAGVLTLEGRATLSEYQEVIRTLVYDNTADAPEDRLVGISVTNSNIVDDTNFSPRTLITVAVGEALTLAAISDQSLAFGQSLNLTLDATSFEGNEDLLDFEVVDAGGLAGQLSVSQSGELTLPVAAQAGSFDVVVAVSDEDGERAEQAFTIDVAEFVEFEGVGALSNVPTALRNDIYTSPPPQNIDTALTYDAVLDTSQGEIRIRLLDDESPTFVNNFVNLARDGFYDGLVFHRVIEGFIGQGGDPLGTGFGGPGYEIPDEVGNDIDFDARGQLSYANSGANTTGSQFFITFSATGLENNPSPFSVFGNVTSGDAVLDQLTRTEEISGAQIPGAIPDVINSITIEEV
jgi:cyclophilin family peptidyl-prolyl cis-trans isomerase